MIKINTAEPERYQLFYFTHSFQNLVPTLPTMQLHAIQHPKTSKHTLMSEIGGVSL